MGLFGNPCSEASFVFGIEDLFHLKSGKDIVVIGTVKGTVRPGCEANVINPGDDEQSVTKIRIKRLEINNRPVSEASDTLVAIMTEAPADLNLRIGSVFFSESSSDDDIYSCYVGALGHSFGAVRRFSIEPENLEKMSIGDLAETWIHARYAMDAADDMTDETRDVIYSRLGSIAQKLISGILSAKEIFYVYNARTDEAHMFSQTRLRDDEYECLPPHILLIPKSHALRLSKQFEQDDFEIRSVENGEDGKGIYNFLGNAFYLNGAAGISVLSTLILIDASFVVRKPSYEGVPKASIPVTNPDLVRWLLLMGQMSEPFTDDADLIHELYYGCFLDELPKARLLIPIKGGLGEEEADEEGNVMLQEGQALTLPIMPGYDGKEAVAMFTDWQKLRKQFDMSWSGMVETVGGIIERYDCAINATKFVAAGCYVDSDAYDAALDRQ
ncbi:MAG: SseB family protein [Lachnospiraceae bacterium]|nr:SseB family protein [Lachnospiraceae bacterium]